MIKVIIVRQEIFYEYNLMVDLTFPQLQTPVKLFACL